MELARRSPAQVTLSLRLLCFSMQAAGMTGVKTVEVRGQVQIAFLLSMQPCLQPATSLACSL